MAIGGYRFRRSFGNVASRFRGARPDTYPLTDPDVIAFAEESGATDLDGLDALVKYVKGEGLYNNFVIYPMKSAQNAGSGATVYSLGGLTDNDMTLVNSPTWATTGITFDGISEFGRISDFMDSSDVTMSLRLEQVSATPTTRQDLYGQYDFGNDNRAVRLSQDGSASGDPYQLFRSDNGMGSSNLEFFNSGGSLGSTNDRQLVSQWIDGGGRSLWFDKTLQSLTQASSGTVSSRYDSAVDITVGASLNNNSGANFSGMEGKAFWVCQTTITTGQREQITDLVNAL